MVPAFEKAQQGGRGSSVCFSRPWRDSRLGWLMAALAGVLNICQEKPGYYVLFVVGAELNTSDVLRALQPMRIAIALTLAATLFYGNAPMLATECDAAF